MPTAIVTGASRGLGRAVAAALAQRGWDLVIDARHPSDLRAAAADLRSIGAGSVEAIPGDVADPRHAARLVTAATRLGPLRLLVNNAGALGPSPLPRVADVALDALADLFRVNVVAPLGLIQLALPELRRNRGRIVNITSDAALEAYPGWGGYGSSKAALEQLSRVLAAEEPEVAVYWFDPGDMRTRMHQEAFPGEDISDRPLPEERVPALVRLVEEGRPSGRYTADELLARAVPG